MSNKDELIPEDLGTEREKEIVSILAIATM